MTDRRTGRRRWLLGCGALGITGLAGCIDDTGFEADDESDEDAPGEDESDDLAFPAGASADGVEDAAALFEAHANAVSAASFTLECTKRRPRRHVDESYTIRANPDAERASRTNHGSGRDVYIDGDRGAVSDGSPVGRRSAADVVDRAIDAIDEWLLELVDGYEGVRTTDAGPVHEFTLRGAESGVAPDGRLEGDGTVLIDEDGRIHRYRTTQTEPDETSVVLEIDISFGAFGATTVEKPDWVDGLGPAGDPRNPIESGARIRLDGRTSGWVGVEPAAIEDVVNPTLILEAGGEYEIGWEEGDGTVHNLELRDANDEVVDDLATPLAAEPSAEQRLEFVADATLASYACDPHQNTMRGEISLE